MREKLLIDLQQEMNFLNMPELGPRGPGSDKNSEEFLRVMTFFPTIYLFFANISLHKTHNDSLIT